MKQAFKKYFGTKTKLTSSMLQLMLHLLGDKLLLPKKPNSKKEEGFSFHLSGQKEWIGDQLKQLRISAPVAARKMKERENFVQNVGKILIIRV